MAMRETAKSLGVIFGAMGVLGLLKIPAVLDPASTTAVRVFALVGLVFACCCLIIGASMKTLLASSRGFVVGVTLAMGCYAAARLIVAVVSKNEGAAVVPVILLLACWYLIVNVRRLSREQRAGAPSH